MARNLSRYYEQASRSGAMIGWYWRRLRLMSPAEIGWRVRSELKKSFWCARRAPIENEIRKRAHPVKLRFVTPVQDGVPDNPDAAATDRLIVAAEGLLDGRWRSLSIDRSDLGQEPDWFRDPVTGNSAPSEGCALRVPIGKWADTGSVKHVWEISRHHHLTVLAAAYFLTGEDRYAERVAAHLRSWWRANPFLTGVHWSSGIELGIRLVSWTWIRRLLAGWAGAADLFEGNAAFKEQLLGHVEALAAFPSLHSSANNHLLAEAAGLFVGCCAFDGLPGGADRRKEAAAILSREVERQTYPSGLSREQATDYHGFVLELLVAAMTEGHLAGNPLDLETRNRIVGMFDALAAVMDGRGRPPRQGDGDDGVGLQLDGTGYDRWATLLGGGAALFGARAWWPESSGVSIFQHLITRCVPSRQDMPDRPGRRPEHFEDAGMTILRAGEGDDEIWCRCDHGPHGFLSLGAHGHADALAIELRAGGVEILADCGTYTYQRQPEWRSYFRSTLAHNTLELAGRDQSRQGGTFLWVDQAQSRLLEVAGLEEGETAHWKAEHNGYADLSGNPIHRREVVLDRTEGSLTVSDTVISERSESIAARLAFHLGPDVTCRIEGASAHLSWLAEGRERTARIHLDPALDWQAHHGSEDPILGWYAPAFGVKVPTIALLGSGDIRPGASLTTKILIS